MDNHHFSWDRYPETGQFPSQRVSVNSESTKSRELTFITINIHKSTVNEAIQIWETGRGSRVLARATPDPMGFSHGFPNHHGENDDKPNHWSFGTIFKAGWFWTPNVFVMDLRWIEMILDMKNQWEHDSWGEIYHDIPIFLPISRWDFLRCGHPVILGAQKALYAGAGHLCLGCSVLQLGIIFHDFFRRWRISILVCTDKHISVYVYVHIYICIIYIYVYIIRGKSGFDRLPLSFGRIHHWKMIPKMCVFFFSLKGKGAASIPDCILLIPWLWRPNHLLARVAKKWNLKANRRQPTIKMSFSDSICGY